MVFKALILYEVTKEEEVDEREGEAPGLRLLPPTLGEICTLQHGVGTLRVSRLGAGRGGGKDVIGSVFQISGSAGSPVVYPISPERGGNMGASH